MTLEQIASRNGVTKNTIRNQLRSVFAKTETNRQAELVQILMSLVAREAAQKRDAS
jgi:DNA-binding CsgD family transcriptional regulator